MNSRLKLKFLFLLIFLLINCDKASNPSKSNTNQKEIIQIIEYNSIFDSLDTYLYTGNITIDRDGKIWFSTVFCDSSEEIPPWSSIACKGLWKLWYYDNNKFHLKYDSLENSIEQVQFDINNNIWLLNSKQILKIDENNKITLVYDISDEEGLFNSITVDNENCVWVGGLNTGIIKINNSEITKYTMSNSKLSTNSSTKILNDNNTIWIALWNNKGIVKINNNNWSLYNSSNTTITNQNIWDLAKDKNENLWIGTGWKDSTVSLMKYDGEKFLVNNPKNKNGKKIPGAVRYLATNNTGEVFVVSKEVINSVSIKSYLSLYENGNWEVIDIQNENDNIQDIEVYNDKLWISTNVGIYQLK